MGLPPLNDRTQVETTCPMSLIDKLIRSFKTLVNYFLTYFYHNTSFHFLQHICHIYRHHHSFKNIILFCLFPQLITLKHHSKTMLNTNLSFNSLLTYLLHYTLLSGFTLPLHIENFKYRHLILTCGYNKPLFTTL